MPSKEEIQQRKARQDSIAAVKADSQAHHLAGRDTSKTKKLTAQSSADSAANTKPVQHTTTKTKREKTTYRQKPASNMGLFSKASQQDTSTITIQTPLYHTTFTNAGAGPVTFTLKKYKTWDEQPVQLISDSTSHSAYNVGFMTTQNLNVNTDQLLFKQITSGDSLDVKKGETKQLKYALKIGDNRQLIYTYTFYGDSYKIGLDISFKGLKNSIVDHSFDLGWNSALNLTEKNRKNDASEKAAYVYSGGEQEELQISEPGHKKKEYSGTIQWVATRTKWFTQIIKPKSPTVGAHLTADITKASAAVNPHHYQTFVKSRISDDNPASFELYLGPLSYQSLSKYDKSAFGMVKIGYSFMHWFANPLVRHIIIPFFSFLGKYMNMGIVIILFAIAIKLVLWPLTHKSFRSMAAMKELQPKMNEIKEKYKDDQQKQQKEIMKMYKEGNVNPLGGCLPQLLQLPILYTLFFYIRNSILLRQQSFLWAHDLSVPDTILHLPFHIPFLGADISGFALLMALAMGVQMKFTGGMGGAGGGAGGMGKMMQYIFPIFMFVFFNHLAAALCLYYFIYNLVNAIQQWVIMQEMEHGDDEKIVKATA
jgi:YidC/Oxa1 family membrane protein insertase